MITAAACSPSTVFIDHRGELVRSLRSGEHFELGRPTACQAMSSLDECHPDCSARHQRVPPMDLQIFMAPRLPE